MKALLIITSLFYLANSLAGEIALSFDDAPMGDSAVMTGSQRTQLLISQLEQHKVPQVIFFSTTHHIDAVGLKRLHAYAEAGHLIGNHSHSHKSANKLGVAAYLDDASIAHDKLKDLPGFVALHRFPYLHHGADWDAIQQLQHGLAKLGYRNGYVTIDNADWYLNHRYEQAVANAKPFDRQTFRQLYVETLWQAIAFYDALAKKQLGKSPKHVLLLHENDTAALFVGDLIKRIRAENWQIISPLEAYTDAALAHFPTTEFHKQGRVAAIAHAKKTPEALLRHPRENTEMLDTLLEGIR